MGVLGFEGSLDLVTRGMSRFFKGVYKGSMGVLGFEGSLDLVTRGMSRKALHIDTYNPKLKRLA